MAHVTVDGNGKITGVYANPQPQLAGSTELADSDPRVVAFLAQPAEKTPPTPRQWLERLSPATQIALETAALSNATVSLWLRKATGNPSIDVTLPETIVGVAAMVSAGLLTPQEQAILLAP